MKSTIRLLLSGLLLFHALLFISCDNDPGSNTDKQSNLEDESTGTIALELVWKTSDVSVADAMHHTAELVLNDDGTIDCDQSKVDKIYVSIYEANGDFLFDNGPGWDCNEHEGLLKNVPVGNSRKLVCLARDENNNVIHRGEQPGINVLGGQTIDPVQITMTSFTCDLLAPEDGAIVNSDTIEFQCGEVENAASYQCQL